MYPHGTPEMFGNTVIAIGCDIKHTGIVLPLLMKMKYSMHPEILINDSLARERKNNGGLKAIKLVANGKFVRLHFQLASLVKIVLDYVVRDHQRKKFRLVLLSEKLREIEEAGLRSQTSIIELKLLHANQIAEKICIFNEEISEKRRIFEKEMMEKKHNFKAKLKQDHFQTTERPKIKADVKGTEMSFLN